MAQTGQTDEATLRTIEVSGQGQVEADVSLGVQREADEAGPALEENNERMTAVISAILEGCLSCILWSGYDIVKVLFC